MTATTTSRPAAADNHHGDKDSANREFTERTTSDSSSLSFAPDHHHNIVQVEYGLDHDDADSASCSSGESEDSFAGSEDDDVPQLPIMITRQHSGTSLNSDLGAMAQQQLATPAGLVLDGAEDVSVGSAMSNMSGTSHQRDPRRGSVSRTMSGRESMRDLLRAQDSVRSLISQESSTGTNGDPLALSTHNRQPLARRNSGRRLTRSGSRRGLQGVERSKSSDDGDMLPRRPNREESAPLDALAASSTHSRSYGQRHRLRKTSGLNRSDELSASSLHKHNTTASAQPVRQPVRRSESSASPQDEKEQRSRKKAAGLSLDRQDSLRGLMKQGASS